ncbi:MAG: uracil-DNA glycosylase [Tepidiformaceae bacterium]
MTSQTSLAEDLYGRVRNCVRCPLSETRTNAVPGEGPLNAEILLIGEAPGANEDREGRPFVGQSGQFLEELLGAAGLKRHEVYICNVLKCRPPANRDPAPPEITACRGYLEEQIAIVDPLVVVTLGRISMAKWFPGETISRIHGSVREADGLFVVPMFHPAAALHQQHLRATILNDFRTLPAVLERARRMRARAPKPKVDPSTTPTPEVQHATAGVPDSALNQQKPLFD